MPEKIKLPKGYKLQEEPTASAPTYPKGYMPYEPSKPTPTTGEELRGEVAPAAGRFAVSSIPAVTAALGSTVGPEGTLMGAGAGSAISNTLKLQFPKLFGEAGDPLEQGARFGGDIISQGIVPLGVEKLLATRLGRQAIGGIPKLLSSEASGATLGEVPFNASEAMKSSLANLLTAPGIRNFPAVRGGAAGMMTKKLMGRYQFPESQIVESAAQNAQNTITDAVASRDPAIVGAVQRNFAGNKIGSKLLNVTEDLTKGAQTQSYKDVADTGLSDLIHVRNWKLATGESKTLEQLALNKLVTNGFKSGEQKLNTNYILNELGGKNKEIYDEVFLENPEALAKFKDLVGEIGKQQEGHGVSDAVLRWSKGHLMWSLPLAATGIVHPTVGAMGAGASTVIMSNHILGRLMSNPETANLVVQAMRTSGTAPEAGIISHVLTNLVRAGEVPVMTPER
jgi:hypothetical protein